MMGQSTSPYELVELVNNEKERGSPLDPVSDEKILLRADLTPLRQSSSTRDSLPTRPSFLLIAHDFLFGCCSEESYQLVDSLQLLRSFISLHCPSQDLYHPDACKVVG